MGIPINCCCLQDIGFLNDQWHSTLSRTCYCNPVSNKTIVKFLPVGTDPQHTSRVVVLALTS